jgi:hypothetical protein
MMPGPTRKYLLSSLPLLLAATPASAAPWWYVGHAEDRALFIDTGSIEREGDKVTYSAKAVIRRQDDPVAMTLSFMRADCSGQTLGWGGVQSFGKDDAVIDTSTRATPEMSAPADPLARAELAFVCADPATREKSGAFPLKIDDAAFTEALLATPGPSPRALQDRLAADPAVPVIRSSAPPVTSFGQVQTVKLGEPLVPPRDYEKGLQIPQGPDYSSIEVGRIYDVAYQGIEKGRIRFEIRGYSIDDLVHPGSGTIQPAYLEEKCVNVLDLAISIREALPDRITYSVVRQKRAPDDVFPPPQCATAPGKGD